jgi:acyl-CoA thioesterase FadM
MRRFERSLRTRGYEMDSTGYIPVSMLASFMEHTRWQSMQDPDFGLTRYWRRGVLRAQRIEVLERVTFDIELVIDCVVGRIGKTSFDLCNQMRRREDGALVARGVATAVNLGERGRPTPIDPAAAELVRATPDFPPLELVPAPPGAWTREITVCPSDQDIQQHVNHARYLDFVEDTRAFALRAGAYAGARELAERPLRRVAISYEREASVGDTLRAATWPLADGTGFGVELRRISAESELLTLARVES